MTPIPSDGLCRVCKMSRITRGVAIWHEPGRRHEAPLGLTDAVLWVCGWPACTAEATARALRSIRAAGLNPKFHQARNIFTERQIPEVKL